MITVVKVMKVKLYVGAGEINFEPLKDEWCVCENPCEFAGSLQ